MAYVRGFPRLFEGSLSAIASEGVGPGEPEVPDDMNGIAVEELQMSFLSLKNTLVELRLIVVTEIFRDIVREGRETSGMITNSPLLQKRKLKIELTDQDKRLFINGGFPGQTRMTTENCNKRII